MLDGIYAYKNKDYGKAHKRFKEIEKENQELPENHYFLGLTLTKLNKYSDAIKYFSMVIKSGKNPFHILQSNMILGYIHTIISKYDQAEKYFHNLLVTNYENPQIYSILGFIYNKKKDFAQAEYYLQKALNLDSDNTNALNSMGYNYIEWDKNIDNALDNIKKAVDKDPNNPAYLDSLGWAYFTIGKLNLAKKYLDKAYTLNRKNIIIKQHLDVVKNFIKTKQFR